MRTKLEQSHHSKEVFLSAEQGNERQLSRRDGCRSCERRRAAVHESGLLRHARLSRADSSERLFVLHASRLVRGRKGEGRRCELVRRQRRNVWNRVARATAVLSTGPRECGLGRGERSIFYHAHRAFDCESQRRLGPALRYFPGTKNFRTRRCAAHAWFSIAAGTNLQCEV